MNQITEAKLKEQYVNLNLLEEGVDRLHSKSKVIRDELHLQNKMIDTLEVDMNESNTSISTVNNKLNTLLKKTKECCNCGGIYIIIFLVVIAIVLLLVIIFL
jgi:t-SNARE complex subunit (syntaxin)